MTPKVSRTNAVKWNLTFQYLLWIVNVIKGFLIVPIYLLKIDLSLYGYWLATGSFLVWINLIDPGVSAVLQQKVGKKFGGDEREDICFTVGGGLILSAAICFIALILSHALAYLLPSLLNLPSQINGREISILLESFQIAAVGACLTLFSSIVRGVSHGLQRTVGPGLIELIAAITGLLVNVYLLYKGFGLYSIAAMILVNGVISLLGQSVFLFVLLKYEKIKLKIGKRFFKLIFGDLLYTFLSRALNTVASNLDLVLIARYFGPEAVTVIEMTRRPFKIVEGLAYKPATALAPAISHLHGQNKKEKLQKVTTEFFIFLIGIYAFLTVGFVLFNKSLIDLWLGPDMYATGTIAFLVVLGVSLKGMFSSFSNINFALGGIKSQSVISSIQNLIYVALLFVFGKYFNLEALMSSLIISVLLTIGWYSIYYIYQKRLVNMSGIMIVIRLLFFTFFIYILAYFFSDIIYAKTWLSLVAVSVAYGIGFLILLLLISPLARSLLNELSVYLKRGKES